MAAAGAGSKVPACVMFQKISNTLIKNGRFVYLYTELDRICRPVTMLTQLFLSNPEFLFPSTTHSHLEFH